MIFLNHSDGNGMIPLNEFQMALLQLNQEQLCGTVLLGLSLAETKVIFDHYSTGRGSPGKKKVVQDGPKLLNWRYFTGRMEAVKRERDERRAKQRASKRKPGDGGGGGGGGRTKRTTLVASRFPNLSSGASTARGHADDSQPAGGRRATGLIASAIKF